MPIIFNEREIHKFSGPTSFTLLRPNIDMFKKYKKKNINLPIVMLFGDIHFSKKNTCDDCEDENEDCSRIFDEDFLYMIDDLSTFGKIDFYIEEYFDNDEIKKTEVLSYKKYVEMKHKHSISFIKDLTVKVLPCLHEKKSNIYSIFCPAKRVNFHSIDIRKSYSTTEYFILYFILHIKKILVFTNADETIPKFKQILDYCLTNNIKYDFYLELLHDILDNKSLDPFFFNTKKFHHSSHLVEDFEKISKLLPSPYNEFSYWIRNMNEYIKFIYDSVSNENISKNLFYMKSFIKIFNNILNILKLQKNYISKLQNILSDDVIIKEELAKEVDDIFSGQLREYRIFYENELKMLKKQLKEVCEKYLQQFLNYKLKIHWKRILMSTANIFMDSFYVLRLIKESFDNKPVFSVGYFGHSHSYFIKYFLINILKLYQNTISINHQKEKYSEILETSDQEIIRCVNFPKEITIDIGEMIGKYKKIKVDSGKKRKRKSKRKSRNNKNKKKMK